MKRIAFRFVVPLLLLSSCAVFLPQLSEQGSRARLMKADPPQGCREVGTVTGAGSAENAKIRMRNQAGELGANYVRWDTVSGDATSVSGTAFACPDSAP